MKNSKTIKPTVKKKKLATSGTSKRIKVIDEYIDCNVQRKSPMTQVGLQRLVLDMYKEISADENITSITQYLLKKGIPRQTYYHWKEKFDYVADAHDVILSIIGDRYQSRMDHDYRYLHFVQPYYDKYVYRKMAVFWSNLKKEEHSQASAPPTVVVIEKAPNCDKVPKKTVTVEKKD